MHFKIILVLFLSWLSVSSQEIYTSNKVVDSLLFVKINEYRQYNHVSTLVWNDAIYQMAIHHTLYQCKTKKVTHVEDSVVDGFNSIKTVKDRYAVFVGNPDPLLNRFSENALGGNALQCIDSTSDFSLFVKTIWKEDTRKLDTISLLVYETIYGWDQSKCHKTNMLSSTITHGAISTLYSTIYIIPNSLFLKSKGTALAYRSYATLNLATINK